MVLQGLLLVLLLPAASRAASASEANANASQALMKTYNGCDCKPTWDSMADDGSKMRHCKESCCNPDEDAVGKWCMVVQPRCEDSDWGYCRPTTEEGMMGSPRGCRDAAAWRDADGDSCFDYAEAQWCNATGKTGAGWHAEWGAIADFAANGYTAFSACCVCGGGTGQGVAAAANPAARHTFNGCKCKASWEQESASAPCSQGCCNPDHDPAGDWCMVEDWDCEEADWGYCRPPNALSTTATGSAGADVAVYNERHGHCNDTRNWKDIDGDRCGDYAINAYCTEVGGYGLGWNLEWGTFATFAAEASLGGANINCCQCGGGKRERFWRGGQNQDSYWDNADKVKSTWSGCACKREWESEGKKCANYCCNKDQDQVGQWCMVEDPTCEDADWGYCATSGLGTATHPLHDSAHCRDVVLGESTPWTDQDTDSCDTYSSSFWCTAAGGRGDGWHEEWGSLEDFAKNGHSALTACCACGGGVRVERVEQTSMESLQGLLEEKGGFMWAVVHGPCKMDSSGCIASQHFPQPYSPREQCQIAVDAQKARPIHVVFFKTEHQYDALKVNGVMYSGSRGPSGIVPSGTVFWGADSQEQKQGWKLCPRGEVDRHPVAKILKALGIAALIMLCCGCTAIIGLYIGMRRNAPHGDGLGAGPTKIGKKYAQQADDA